jgi:hypothetical protein
VGAVAVTSVVGERCLLTQWKWCCKWYCCDETEFNSADNEMTFVVG